MAKSTKKSEWAGFRNGKQWEAIANPKKKAINYSLVYPNKVTIYTGCYAVCKTLQKSYKHSLIQPNF